MLSVAQPVIGFKSWSFKTIKYIANTKQQSLLLVNVSQLNADVHRHW